MAAIPRRAGRGGRRSACRCSKAAPAVRASKPHAHATTGRWRNITAKRSEEHTSELQSLMRISYAVFCLKKKKLKYTNNTSTHTLSHTQKLSINTIYTTL